MIQTYSIPELMPYINWCYLYFAWGVKPSQPEAAELRAEAERMLHHLSLNGVVARAACSVRPAYAEGDDVVLPAYTDDDGPKPAGRIAFLRQQHADPGTPCLSLADFIAPRGYTDPTHVADRIGLFATTVAARHECPCCVGNVLMLQTVSDRLAEAAAEVLHLEVRRRVWGYAPDETLTIAELHQEHFQGIRPAIGYPSLPDQSIIFDIARHLPMARLGISLTENGMMQPHASTCGLMLAHPAARYFSVGPVADDQLADYARRRGMDAERLRKFLPR